MKAARVGNTVLSPVSIQKYASKIKSAQETQQTQENDASKKQKYANASYATDASWMFVNFH